jgi:ubiquinol-cytochrome c reductase cytochrome b subunit/ubiquinol-cytochrome c reductase cytochrome c1 subunit
LVYVGEPIKATRERLGWYVIFYFLIFTALSSLLYREFHKDYNK